MDTSSDAFLTNVSLSPSTDSDPQVGTGDLSAGSANLMETDAVTVTVTAHNLGVLPAENVLAAFFAGEPQEDGVYLGSAFLSTIAPGGTGTAAIAWDTTGYQGDIEIYAVLDAAEQFVELNDGNNSVHIPITVRTRPDLQVAAITLTDRILIGASSTAVASGVTETVSIPWIPTDLGPLTLYAVADNAESVSEFDEANNRRTLAGYVGWGAPVYLNTGGSPNPVYDPAQGYGFLAPGTVICYRSVSITST